ncbi:MAG: hypothetical protein U0790_12955 [Isosphaeraceae bacterium]
MSDPENGPSPTIDRLIDRMVDGSLRPSELREAVARLDRTPDGWRRCALAFLEAQSWGDAMRHMDAPAVQDIEVRTGGTLEAGVLASPFVHREGTRTRPKRSWAGHALAASLILAAFALGWAGRGWGSGTRPGPPPTPERAASPAHAGDEAVAKVDPVPTNGDAAPAHADELSGLIASRTPEIREVARLRFGDGRTTVAEVPILAGNGIDERWLLEQPPAVSERQRALWERQGYQLEQQRRLVSVPLADGRRAAVPIDQVKVRYVGHDPL